MVWLRLLLVFCHRLFAVESLVEEVLLDEGVIGLAMVVEMAKTQHLASLMTSLQYGRKVCASRLKHAEACNGCNGGVVINDYSETVSDIV
nr:hypothetical protein [Tanacetum cinerariifolium]